MLGLAPVRFALVFPIGLLLTACGGNEYVPPPPPAVTAAQPVVADVVRYLEYTGTTRAVESVQIRARVKGFLQSMHFQPGEAVEKGKLLFVIDPEAFELERKAAEARVTARRAELALAETEFDRTRALYESKATSEIRFIQARSRRDTALADLGLAEADARSAELDVDYAHVKAPLSGRVGRHLVDVGNLVGSGEATPLTQIVRYSPLYVYFYLSERDLLDIQETSAARRKAAGADWKNRPATPVYIGRANDDGYPFVGAVDYTALEVDPQTGTFEVRAVMRNEGELDEVIVPGTFVRVQIPISLQKDALLVSERALGADQNGRFVMLVGRDDVAEQRSIEVGPERRDGLRVVKSGLSANDWVIVQGLQRARAGSKVAVEKTTLDAPDEVRREAPSGHAAPRGEQRPKPASEATPQARANDLPANPATDRGEDGAEPREGSSAVEADEAAEASAAAAIDPPTAEQPTQGR